MYHSLDATVWTKALIYLKMVALELFDASLSRVGTIQKENP
jgi:hypothetical protein